MTLKSLNSYSTAALTEALIAAENEAYRARKRPMAGHVVAFYAARSAEARRLRNNRSPITV